MSIPCAIACIKQKNRIEDRPRLGLLDWVYISAYAYDKFFRKYTVQIRRLEPTQRSKRAIQVSIHIVRVFVKLREVISTHKDLQRKMEKIEIENEKNKKNIEAIFKVLAKLMRADPKDKDLKIIGFSEKG